MRVNIFDLIIAALAVWRVSNMVKREHGPWDIFIRIREKLGDSMLGKLIDCPYCSSVWIAPMVFIPGARFVVICLAISAMAIILEVTIGMLRARNPLEVQVGSRPYPGQIHRGGTNVQSGRTYDRKDPPF
jgi:hypothetical protein